MILSVKSNELRTMVLVRCFARKFLESVLAFVSDFMGEEVTPNQLGGVVLLAVGMIMVLCIMGSPLVGVIGLVIMYLGSRELQEKEESVC